MVCKQNAECIQMIAECIQMIVDDFQNRVQLSFSRAVFILPLRPPLLICFFLSPSSTYFALLIQVMETMLWRQNDCSATNVTVKRLHKRPRIGGVVDLLIHEVVVCSWTGLFSFMRRLLFTRWRLWLFYGLVHYHLISCCRYHLDWAFPHPRSCCYRLAWFVISS